jgi:intracellular sulfur oxidation DsrE/DsrF family protein
MTNEPSRGAANKTVMTRSGMIRSFFTALALGALAGPAARAEESKPKSHRVVIQVDQNDPAVMNLALNNARNLLDYYRDKHEDVAIELVAYGPGLHMLREDTSPVKDRIKELSDVSFPSKIVFSACHNTMEGMEKREGRPIPIVAQAGVVPAGVVRIVELQEQGYGYVKP